jgi:hypothetical protein
LPSSWYQEHGFIIKIIFGPPVASNAARFKQFQSYENMHSFVDLEKNPIGFIKKGNDIFALKISQKQEVVYLNNHLALLLNKKQFLGSGIDFLIVPRNYSSSIKYLPNHLFQEMIDLAKRVAAAYKEFPYMHLTSFKYNRNNQKYRCIIILFLTAYDPNSLFGKIDKLCNFFLPFKKSNGDQLQKQVNQAREKLQFFLKKQ